MVMWFCNAPMKMANHCIRFSADSLSYMRDGKLDVAKAMIEAGMEAASEIADDGVEDFLGEFADTEEKPVYH